MNIWIDPSHVLISNNLEGIFVCVCVCVPTRVLKESVGMCVDARCASVNLKRSQSVYGKYFQV